MKVIMFPGQGAQYRGMGKNLFEKYKDKMEMASNILGYDLEELCLKDPKRVLNNTEFTQPALFVVNALKYEEQFTSTRPDYLIGHSLGEYNALLAAGAFDFETGVRIVQKRGTLMGEASGGSMAAVLGLDEIVLKEKLKEGGYTTIDVANFNTPTQIVVSGPKDAIDEVVKDFDQQNIKIVQLQVTAPFHSRYMQSAVEEFDYFIQKLEFNSLKIPVISNVTARNYEQNQIKDLLSKQIASSVQWVDSIRFLMGKNVQEYEEVGGDRLTKMVEQIKSCCSPIYEETKEKVVLTTEKQLKKEITETAKTHKTNTLGSSTFCERYNTPYAYVAGGLHMGIASTAMVLKMANSKMLGFLGTKGRTITEINKDIERLQDQLIEGNPFGVNLYQDILDPNKEIELVNSLLESKIRIIEAGGFSQITLALAYFRIAGLERNSDQGISCKNHIIAKIARPDVAEGFMKPVPERLVKRLLDKGWITQDQAEMASEIPLSGDICTEADPGGVTHRTAAFVLFPSIKNLRNQIQQEYKYNDPIHLGISGGIGTPEAVASAFIMEADFVLTGSINQCTVESGLSEVAKELLQNSNVQDTAYIPDEELFEIGIQAQVLKKDVLFATRAKKLYELYQRYDCLEAIPNDVKEQLETKYFKRTLSEVWQIVRREFVQRNEIAQIESIEERPKKKMATLFKYYLRLANQYALEGIVEEQSNFQIQTGAALGAFNQWVKGTSLEAWQNRHVDQIGMKIMETAAELIKGKSTLIEV
ncbi:ACP S-malonyltransferase [Flavobacterium poyangense]|uniref:ACP S-malonyltransferase n=1 Tax=Flavobacterium poyangense TaxID=2204302 RepID=UPI00141D7C47|nr:ACP S-malonyltransferase [Flavobacterium sp. JXAS1]